MTYYLVTRFHFDSLENELSAAICSRVLGVALTEETADAFVNRCKGAEGYWFKGWDGEMYPQFRVDKIKAITQNSEPVTSDTIVKEISERLRGGE